MTEAVVGLVLGVALVVCMLSRLLVLLLLPCWRGGGAALLVGGREGAGRGSGDAVVSRFVVAAAICRLLEDESPSSQSHWYSKIPQILGLLNSILVTTWRFMVLIKQL